MTIRARVLNQKRLQKKLRQIPTDQRTAIGKAIAISVKEVQGEAVRGIQRGGRSGVIVTRGGRTHQRSGPGEFPKTDTGRLAGSIFAEVDADRLGGEVGTNVGYGTHLEFGTTKMAARPWLFPTFERLKKRITARIAKAAEQAHRRSAR